jgi:nucleotide-binding universal stress UspA family protein
MDLKRILVAIISPNGRDAAFERALALARSSGAELYLLHAVPVNQPFSFRAAERLERMVDMRKRAEDAGVPVQTVEQHGDPAEIIELHANAREVDLIVMGGEARLGWGRHRSLVAERVIRRTNVPTLVVASDAADRPTAFRNVLVALDLSRLRRMSSRVPLD